MDEDYSEGGSDMMGSEDMDGMVYRDEDGNIVMYGDQMMGSDEEGMDHIMMGDSYGHEGSPGDGDDQDVNFDENPAFANMPPLDKMRKIRRDIIKSINEYREVQTIPGVYQDILANKAATEYAEFLLLNDQDHSVQNEILNKLMIVGTVSTLVGYSYLEEDDADERVLHHEFMDAHGVLCEFQEDLDKILDPKFTHVGIGFAWNKEKVLVVEFFSIKPLMINQLTESEDGGVDVRGMMLSNEVGLYAARIIAAKNMKKDIKVVGPSNIQFDKNTRTFIITIEGPVENLFYSDDPKILEIYIRKSQIDKILYGQPSQERINVAHLELAMRLPMEYIPDPRTVIEDAQDKEKEERDAAERRKREQEEKMVREAQKLVRQEEKKKKREALAAARAAGEDVDSQYSSSAGPSEKSGSKKSKPHGGDQRSMQSPHARSEAEDKSKTASERQSLGKGHFSQGESDQQSDEDGHDDDDDHKEESMDEIADLPSQNEMKRELIIAIEEELREQEALKKQNDELQRQIILMDSTFEQQDKQPDVSMNEHKYLNTLANVHQVRFNLKETQDRYNKMASELQAKLNEKQAKCHEIEQQFKELKRSVAQNAVFSRTGKKISKKVLDEWEEMDALKDQEVHQYRLQNIALRNRLANKEKILKKKEQLADGLHLIDFEQLKIENQTLNEKIEERNEELHKLRKKITTTVVILSHTREKLQYVQEQNRQQNEKLKDLNDLLNNEKTELSRLKKNRESLWKENQKLRQKTGIVNKKSLKTDYDKRDEDIKSQSQRIISLQEYHSQLTKIIERANQIQMAKMTN